MSNKKNLEDRYADEVFTDNSQIKSYPQCKDCLFRGVEINKKWIADGDRASCRIFSPPAMKPMEFYHGTAKCEFYEKE